MNGSHLDPRTNTFAWHDVLYIAAILALALSHPTPWSVDHYRSSKRGIEFD